MNHRKERSFLLGGKGELFFLSQKRKVPLKTSLFHLVFTDVNTSFVHAVNSPLFSEQQKRYEAGFACKRSLEPCKGLENKKFLGHVIYHKVFTSYCGMNMSLVINIKFKFFAWAIKSRSKGSLWIKGKNFVVSMDFDVIGAICIFACTHGFKFLDWKRWIQFA